MRKSAPCVIPAAPAAKGCSTGITCPRSPMSVPPARWPTVPTCSVPTSTSALRRTVRMRRSPDKSSELRDHAIGRAADAKVPLTRVRGCVHHHRHVDVVEGADSQHLLLAGEELEAASSSHLQPLFDLDELLR